MIVNFHPENNFCLTEPVGGCNKKFKRKRGKDQEAGRSKIFRVALFENRANSLKGNLRPLMNYDWASLSSLLTVN